MKINVFDLLKIMLRHAGPEGDRLAEVGFEKLLRFVSEKLDDLDDRNDDPTKSEAFRKAADLCEEAAKILEAV